MMNRRFSRRPSRPGSPGTVPVAPVRRTIVRAAVAMALVAAVAVPGVFASPGHAVPRPAAVAPSQTVQSPDAASAGRTSTATSASATPGGASPVDVRKFLDQHKSEVAGVGFAQIDGDNVDPTYYGLSNIKTRLPVTKDSVFEWGSISKVVVWVSVMQLVEQGRLDLNADIATYLPQDFVWHRPDRPVTMLDLMNHTGGWADQEWGVETTDPGRVMGLRASLERLAPRSIFAPGSTVAYSNYGGALAGYIVERVSGQPFWQYARDHVLVPAGLTHTTIEPTQADRPDLARRRDAESSYTTDRAEIPGQRAYLGWYPAGGTVGTLTDLARFAQALMPPAGESGPLFTTRAGLDAMFQVTHTFPDGSPENAHGLWAFVYDGHTYWGHGGNTTGQTANLLIDPTTRRGVVAMTNTADETVATSDLVAKVLGSYPQAGVAARGVGAPSAAGCTGVFLDTRRSVGTVNALESWVLPVVVTATDGTTLNVMGTPAVHQVAPGVFSDGKGQNVWCTAADGHTVLRRPLDQLDQVGWPEVVGRGVLMLAFVLGPVAALVTLAASGLRAVVRRPARSRLRLWRNLGNAYLVVALVNTVALVARMMAPGAEMVWSRYLPHFVINGLAPAAAAGYVVATALSWRRAPAGRWERTMSVVTGTGLLLSSATVVVFDLWH